MRERQALRPHSNLQMQGANAWPMVSFKVVVVKKGSSVTMGLFSCAFMEIILKEQTNEHHSVIEELWKNLPQFRKRRWNETKKTAYDPRLQNTKRFPFAGNNPPEQNPFFYNRFCFRNVFQSAKEKLKEKGIIKVKYSELNPEDSFSAWYNSRKI